MIEYGEYQFGHPSRISARTYVGRSGVMVIEREVHLSGRIHNKGVLTLEGYLHGQYATKEPLSLAASMSFEQNYSEIEGDSASSTELYVLLSALADLPIKQGIAVTGSVDQQGRVQPVGRRAVQDRRLLRRVPGARPDGRAGRDDSRVERAALDAARRCGSGLPRRRVSHLGGQHDRRRAGTVDRREGRSARQERQFPQRQSCTRASRRS